MALQKLLQNFMQPLIFDCTKRYDSDPICTSTSTSTSTLTPPPPPLPPRSKDKRKMQSSGIDLDVKIFHIDVSLFLLTLTARRRNYLFKKFLLYLRCGGALLLSVAKCIGLAMWMFIRSKELQINKYGRVGFYCHCAVLFVLLLVKPRMIAK